MEQVIDACPNYNLYEDISRQMESLMEIGNQIRGDSALKLSSAMEADAIIPHKNILSTYFGADDRQTKHRLATESIADGIVEAVKNLYKMIVEMIKRAIAFIQSFFTKKKFTGTKEQVDGMKDILSDHETEKAVDDAMQLLNQSGVSMEDAGPKIQIDIGAVFEAYQQALSEHELDFITSGHRYKIIKDVIVEFTSARYHEFVNKYTDEVDTWVELGLNQSPHIGKDETVVYKFKMDEQRKLTGIKEKYTSRFNSLEELERMCFIQNTGEKGTQHLEYFKRKPSALFPHLEHIWKSVPFDRIGDDDRKLMVSLEKVKKRFEDSSKRIDGKLKSERDRWPARDEMLRMANRANKEIMECINSLVRVVGFIRHSADTAYNATVKSFNYITRMLNAIGKLPGIDRERLMQCIDVIQKKRRAIDQLTQIA